MFARVFSAGLTGIEAYKIEVEVDMGGGIGQIHIVGLPDAAVKESQERVRSAIKASDFIIPPAKRWIVNLAPADTRKEGPSLDLPIAIGMLASMGAIIQDNISSFWIVGELGLDGALRPVSGALSIALACKSAGFNKIIVPEANAKEASLVEGLEVYGFSHLKQVSMLLMDTAAFKPFQTDLLLEELQLYDQNRFELDFEDVKGQNGAKRALEIVAAGRHNLLMVGPPGSGKSMLAQRLPSIMPPLSFSEALEVTKIHSVTGLHTQERGLITQRPYRSPHHSASAVGLTGGGSHPRPGEISLSHMGVLFLDELTEFSRSHLDQLREPLETGNITITRANNTMTYPASFIFVGACNPCPCGYRGDSQRHCVCGEGLARRYWAKVSGPLLDRIDLQVAVRRLSEAELKAVRGQESSQSIRLRVRRAAEMQQSRFPDGKVVYNAQLNRRQVEQICRLDSHGREHLVNLVYKFGLSARSYDRILKTARTIADLEGLENIEMPHLNEALRYRNLSYVFA